jgi:hypothetical protein
LDCGIETGTVHTGLAFVWTKKHEHNSRVIANIVKDGYNGIKRESILAKNAREELTLRREKNFSCSKRSYIGKERKGGSQPKEDALFV